MLALDQEIKEAEEEGITIHPSLGVTKITTKRGKASGIETVTCVSVREPDGSFNPQYDTTCKALSLEAESIIIAIGQAVDPSLTTAFKKEGKVLLYGGRHGFRALNGHQGGGVSTRGSAGNGIRAPEGCAVRHRCETG